MTALIAPAQLRNSAPLRRPPLVATRPPRVWKSLSQTGRIQLASTLAEMVRRMEARGAGELHDVSDHHAR
jgi:hypothetical protein